MAITGLVLQGGGALGAFEPAVIESSLDNGIRPGVVSGVSIGAINATVLCGCRHSDTKSVFASYGKISPPSASHRNGRR